MSPQAEAQRWLLSRALQISGDIAEARWQMFERTEAPWPFLTILVFRLVTLFVSFGLLAPRNATVLFIFLFCSLSVASAVFLIVDMEHPFSALFKSPALRCATPLTNLAGDRFSAAGAAPLRRDIGSKRCHDTRIVGDAPPDANRDTLFGVFTRTTT
jgi:hypothetical protein